MLHRSFLIKIEAKKLNIEKRIEEVVHGFGGFEIQKANDSRRPDLLVLELGTDANKDFQLIQQLLNMDAVGEVFVMSERVDQNLLMQAMRIGVKEFIAQPLDEVDVMQALDRFEKRAEETTLKGVVKEGSVMAVMGIKGGVGCTTVAVNLAVSLAEKDSVRAVALLDMNMLFGEVPLFLEIAPKHHWGEVIKSISRLDTSFLMNTLCRHASGVQVLSAPGSFFAIDDAETPKAFERLLGLMKTKFDYVVIDAGIATEGVSLRLAELVDQVLLVSIMSLPCLAHTGKLLKIFEASGRMPKEHLKVVINHYTKDTDFSLRDAEKSMNKSVFWTIPHDLKATISAINQGSPLSQVAPKAPITKNLQGLADALAETEEHSQKGLLRFLKRAQAANDDER